MIDVYIIHHVGYDSGILTSERLKMKVYKSMMFRNVVYSVVKKLIYGGGEYWVVIKGRLCDEAIFKCKTRDEAVNYMMSLFEMRKVA